MELLKTIDEKEVYPTFDNNGEKNKYRKAVRAVVFDNENKVAILNVKKYNYYKLPGGGIENGESMEEALKRECLEEIGCNIEVLEEVGRVLEHRNKIETDQESFCYTAKLVGEKGNPSFVGYEIDDGFEPLWVDIDQAIKLVENSEPTSYDGPFIKIRDFILLNKAKQILNKMFL